MDDLELIRRFRSSPLAFIEAMWGLVPQPLQDGIPQDEPAEFYNEGHFKPFQRGKMLTWQQWLLFRAIEYALAGKAQRRISVESGHGTGKSASLAMIILWYLFCFQDAQVPCTAPTTDQMYDVLWKELSVWLGRMPEGIRQLYEWQSAYVRIRERPETWFARAKTARKEAPEALAGIHADHVLMIVDEASGVPEEVFATAEGALTNANILVLLISNHTRIVGYFHETHNSDKENWQRLSFDSRQSPIVDHSFVQRIIEKYGEFSDEFRIRVMGIAPKEEAMDDKGWVPLLNATDLHETETSDFIGLVRLGVDAAGEGKDKAVWVVRDPFRAMVVAEEPKSTPKTMAKKTITNMTQYNTPAARTWVDNFGEGANVATEIALAIHEGVNAVNVGDEASDKETFVNRRAEAFWRLRQWLKAGGELVANKAWKDELLCLRYRRNLDGRLQIMGKVEMKKEGLRSPDHADALMLTFYEADDQVYDDDQSPDETFGGPLG